MEQLLIDFKFDAQNIQSAVGNFNAVFSNATVEPGPGNSEIGKLTKAINLGTSGKCNVDLTGLPINTKKFCIQVGFKVNTNVTTRQNIVESNFLPFALYAIKGKQNNLFKIVTSVKTTKHGWSGVDTGFNKKLEVGKWYVASLVYDLDTLGVFIDNQLIAVHGFPNGAIKLNTTKKIFFGTWVDGARNHFNGALSGFKWYDGIPVAFESLLDEQRSQAEWYITYKHAQIRSKINTGKKEKDIVYDAVTGSHTQFYERCGIMYHENVGVAFEMHGSIYKKYKAMRNKSDLGYLVTDESKATNTIGRKSLFSKGGIYWSSATKAIPVLGEIYLEYENLEESKVFGFPTRSERSVPGGKEQIFQKCRMYYKNGSGRAQEVHGSILAKYLRLGGVRKWGFPVTNETDVKRGRTTIGKFSEFEHCTIFWKRGLGAFEVHGSIRKKYLEELGGAIGRMGFPTSDEIDIPNHSGTGRMNTFEKGSVLWYGSYSSICVATGFKIFMQRINSRENEGVGMGQNDLFFRAKVKNGSTTIYDKRHPRNGDYGNHNIKTVNITIPNVITPNKANMVISFKVAIRDADPFNNSDHLGTQTKILNASNAWGFRQPNRAFNDSFSKIRSFTWSIKPTVNINLLSEVEKWWSFKNFRTPVIKPIQYASAFEDVDSEAEWWDVLDWLKKAFYEIAVKDIGAGGNCFGMSLEAIYARKCMSLFGQPMDAVVKNNTSVNEINIKHAYQVGARPIWWFLGQFVSGNTHDPKDVFNETLSAFRRGDHPVVCISQNYDFSGGPHCILPVAWRKRGTRWEMDVMDPNCPGEVRTLFVNPNSNSYKYKGASRDYAGTAWAGGRLHYMPFCILDTPQRTPVWDAILLLLSGVILILADDAETVSIKDANGKDLDGNGTRANKVLKDGGKPEEFFASFTGFDTQNVIKPGQILLRKEKLVSSSLNSEVVNLASQPVSTIIGSRRIGGFNTVRALPTNTNLRASISTRSAHHILNDASVAGNLSTAMIKKLKSLTKINNKRNFQHEVKGAKNGKLDYIIKSGLSEIKIESTIKRNEKNLIKVNDLNTNACNVDFKSPQAKNMNLQITNKFGVNGDHVIMNIKNIQVQANKSLAFNIKRGLSGIEIVNNGVTANLPVKFTGKVDGKIINKSFTVPFDNALRVKPSTIINTNNLTVSKISKLFGTVKSTSIIDVN